MANVDVGVALPPPLKWAGGKRWLVPRLRELWAQYSHRRLVEPFVGGLAVTLGLQPSQALLNDVNVHVINFYRWLSRGLVTSLEMENTKDVYYARRERFNQLIAQGAAESAEAAALFYYLNRTGYNGLCRFNQKGLFNVPFGRHKTINYCYDFTHYAELMQIWQFERGDFAQLALEADDFVYADPPYDVEFTTYSAGGFGWDDQVRLAEWLSMHQGPVVASNQATERILKLYESLGFEINVLQAPRRIACTGDRSRAAEMLAVKGCTR